MIYKSSYFKEELKKSFIEGKKGNMKLLMLTIGVSLLTILINSCVTTLSSTVVGDIFSAYCSRSYFSIISCFNFVMLIFFVLHVGQNYSGITFAEIDRNRWYMLRKSGYKTRSIVASKQLTTLIMALVIYCSGVIFLTFFCLIFQYTMLMSAMPSLIFAGLLKILFVLSIVMTASLFLAQRSSGYLVGIVGIILVIAIENATGFYGFMSSTLNMQNFSLLFVGSKSSFTYILLVSIVLLMALTSIVASLRADYYFIDKDFGDGILVVDYKTNKTKTSHAIHGEKLKKVVKYSITTVMCVFMFFVVAANVFIIAFGNATGSVFTIGNYTPLLFGSQTMTGKINQNDLVLFENNGTEHIFAVDDVILYYDNANNPQVKIIEEITDDGLFVVDYYSYPQGTENDSAQIITDGSEFVGTLAYTNRWLGAWLVWNNSTIGRILLLAIPVCVIVFYDKIALLFRKIKDSLGYDLED